ncbi:hypothetical protein BJY26_000385 [Spelaeicoccus albus]|uniref:Uncharacterized protein n=1 Tax=Spelaeicoccus albus TaxID=1280376 RepID=A0A7Z0A7W9_9MICO|nr:hypothetical protein [Spelaeicoccus albus]
MHEEAPATLMASRGFSMTPEMSALVLYAGW